MWNSRSWKRLWRGLELSALLLAGACSSPLPGLTRIYSTAVSELANRGEPVSTPSPSPAQGQAELLGQLATQTAVSALPLGTLPPSPLPRTPSQTASSALTSTPTSASTAPAPTASPSLTPEPEPESEEVAHRIILPLIFLNRHPLEGASLWVDPNLPAALREGLALPAALKRAETAEEADLRLAAGGEAVVSRWVYALVAPFPVMEREASLEAVRGAWQGAGRGGSLLMETGTLAVFSTLWGPPGEGAVRVLPAGELLDYAWDHQESWALVPFEAVEPRWTVLEVDGLSPLHKDFLPDTYPLSVPVGFQGEAGLVQQAVEALGPGAPEPLLPASNRDGSKLTVLAMTGVTALVRATAHTMERQGIEYPGQDIRLWLEGADLTHISNEVPFARDCPPPNPLQAEMRFCSDPRYIKLLESVGTDIVELTGDHFQDWGTEAMRFTLDLYEERGWLTYGGGENLSKARQAVTVEHNGNRLAFIGCNAKGGGYAQAGEDRPGAAACDMDWMEKETRRLRAEGYLPVATFQHFEYYTYAAQPDQRRDFRALAQAGAVIVSGSQAHQPQAIEFSPEAGGTGFIHYGLGNLFFDQYDVSLACRQAFIDRHVFYNGRYLGVELLPILFVDYARARPMQADERRELLRSVFGASGW